MDGVTTRVAMLASVFNFMKLEADYLQRAEKSRFKASEEAQGIST